jgi:hypothetical protein
MHQRRDGSFPFVLLLATSHAPDPAASGLLAEARARVEARQHVPPSVGSDEARPANGLRSSTPEAEYAEARQRVCAALPPGATLDRSRLDHSLATRLLRRGASPRHVSRVLHAGERAAEMTTTDAEAYVARTVAAAQEEIAQEGADHGGASPGRGEEERERGR